MAAQLTGFTEAPGREDLAAPARGTWQRAELQAGSIAAPSRVRIGGGQRRGIVSGRKDRLCAEQGREKASAAPYLAVSPLRCNHPALRRKQMLQVWLTSGGQQPAA